MATTISSPRITGDSSSNSSDLWKSTVWHKSAPQAVRKAYAAGKMSKGWTAWSRYLAERARPQSLGKLMPGNSSPLGWALPEGSEDRGTNDFLERIEILGQGSRARSRSTDSVLAESTDSVLADWMTETSAAPLDSCYALEALALCHVLPRLANSLTPERWWQWLDHLTTTAVEAERMDAGNHPLAQQLLAGELPLTLAYQFPEIKPCRKLAALARRTLSAGLVDLLDGEGLPHADRLAVFRPLLAMWTRCRAMGRHTTKGCWSDPAQTQYEWMVRAALRLARPDGSQMFSQGATGGWCKDLFDAALKFGGDEDDRDIAALALPSGPKAAAASISELALPQAGNHSEWAGATVLRPDWSRSAPRLAVLWPGDSVRLELATHRGVLWSGKWDLEVALDGKPLEPASDWEEICWISDDEVDYLELEIDLSGGLRVQRQMALAREDRFLFLADAVLGNRPGRLEYRGSLPLDGEISFQAAQQTCEGLLGTDKPAALVMPLALPEWRASRHSGSLAATAGRLELCQTAEGRSLFAPLFFDLAPRRMTRRLTWRQLTVAEHLEIQPAEVAVGYRVMVGKSQWLIYRSLSKPANRTLLGHNLSTEMLIARFHRDGEVESLMEI